MKEAQILFNCLKYKMKNCCVKYFSNCLQYSCKTNFNVLHAKGDNSKEKNTPNGRKYSLFLNTNYLMDFSILL